MAAPLLFLLRAMVVVGLVLGTAPRPVRGMEPALEPTLAMAMAAGAVCLGDPPDGLAPGLPPPGHVHEGCGACLGVAAGLAATPQPVPSVPALSAGCHLPFVALVRVPAGRAAYASRAPPPGMG